MTDTSVAAQTVKVWDLPLRLFHWLLVAAIAVAFLSSEGDSPLASWHMASGWFAAVLLAFRLAWGFVGSQHSRFAEFIGQRGLAEHLRGLASGRPHASLGHNPVGAVAVVVLLGLVAATVWLGIDAAGGGEEDLHETIAWILLGVVAIHVAAVIATSALTRENLARAMVTGRKPAALHPGASNYRPASLLGFAVAVAVAGVAAWGALQIDPAAFLPQQREEGESGDRSDDVAHGHVIAGEAREEAGERD